jgi:hypothetical protein
MILRLAVFTFFFSITLTAQIDTLRIDHEEIIEDLLQEPSDDSDEPAVYEYVESLITNPININTADLIELQKIPYVDLSIAQIIINHRLFLLCK